MAKLPHLMVRGTAVSQSYTPVNAGGRGAPFQLPPRDSRPQHADRLRGQLDQAEQQATAAAQTQAERPQGITLEFRSEPGFDLWLESLDRPGAGIELLSVKQEGDVQVANVFVPDGALGEFERLLEQYLASTTPSGNPQNQRLIESISQVRLAAVRSIWTDDENLYPASDEAIWWEVWVRTGRRPNTEDAAFAEFVATAAQHNIRLTEQVVRFPERAVLLALCRIDDWAASLALLNRVAELRRAKEIPTDYVELPPRDQGQFVEDLLARLTVASQDAPAVLLLDTGVNREHPLLVDSLHEVHWLAADPAWSPADRHPQQHGTGMAGLALYGCLTEPFGHRDPVHLRHRLESVKILPDGGQSDPENWGAITEGAIAQAEVESPWRSRAICLAVTADDRDRGHPTAWSAAVDQLCSGALDDERRLVIVSAGNLGLHEQTAYPQVNHERGGIEDPAQSWNALTVGAFTDKVHIRSRDYDGWQPIAEHGGLSPSSRTSLPWTWYGAPLKPDVVMEGGNCAIDRSGTRADAVDDLSLLTTTLHPTGRLLTTFGDTSAAAAQAARMAAIIQAEYPRFWPETVRGLIVHSARWTKHMRDEFPHKQRSKRLGCYGHGVPNLGRALYSAESRATLIIQDAIQPYRRDGNEIRPKEMHLHRLPWPVEVLEDMGEQAIKLRVTLSYFIEPSPARRGHAYRYQSHGLRFDVKRPAEGEAEFLSRLSKDAWENPESRPRFDRDNRRWLLGKNLRARGSLHSDAWSGTATDLASSGMVAVYPVTGWWRERSHLERFDRQARYALIVSLETDRTLLSANIYAAIQQVIDVSQTITIEW